MYALCIVYTVYLISHILYFPCGPTFPDNTLPDNFMSIWGHFWVDLGSIWGGFGVDLGWVWVGLGSVWDQFGVDLGSVCGGCRVVVVAV